MFKTSPRPVGKGWVGDMGVGWVCKHPSTHVDKFPPVEKKYTEMEQKICLSDKNVQLSVNETKFQKKYSKNWIQV